MVNQNSSSALFSHPFITNHQWKTWRIFFPRWHHWGVSVTGCEGAFMTGTKTEQTFLHQHPYWPLVWTCGYEVSPALEGAERSPRCLVVLWHVTAVSCHSYLSVRAQAVVQMWRERVHIDFKASKSWSRWSELTSQPCTFFSDGEPWPLLYQIIRFQKSFKEKRPSWQNNLSAVVYSFKIK